MRVEALEPPRRLALGEAGDDPATCGIGEGIPYFAGLETTPVKLAQPKVVEGKGVTHLYHEVER
jgi:hypothetical protein